MPKPLYRPAALAGQVFRGRDAIDAGLLTEQAFRTRAWQRLLHGVYADSRLPVDHGVRCEAAALVLPAAGAIAGLSAAWLYGAQLAGADDPVEVLVPPAARFGPYAHLRIHTTAVDAGDIHQLGGFRITSPLRAAWDIAVWHGPETAVPAIDWLARLDVVDLRAFEDYTARQQGAKGWRRAARLAPLVDGRAESPQESRLRIRLITAGLPAPVPQFRVMVDGHVIARVDLAWPESAVAVEYDGAWHAATDQLHRDRRRLNQLTLAGWFVLHVTADRMNRDFGRLLAELRAALSRKTWSPGRGRPRSP